MSNDRSITVNRRTWLHAISSGGLVGGIAALAGCVELGDDDDGDGDDETTPTPSPTPEPFTDVTVTLSQFPDTIDPLDHITGDYFDVYDHIYEPLFNFEPGEGIFPRVAEDWEAQGDGTTHVFLQDDIVFHNGDSLTAEDVAWTINRTVDPDIGVQSPIGTFGLGSITGAEAVDDHTVSISYNASPGLAEFEFGNYARAINKDWAIENHDAENSAISGADPEDFNGTGPLRVIDYEDEVEVVTEAFDDYWGDPVPFETVTFNADTESSGRATSIEAGETHLTINIIPEDVDTIEQAEHADVRQVTSFRTIFLPMKNTVEPFDSLEFRQAMNYAVDNEQIVNTVLSGFGEPTSQPVAPGINGHNPALEPYEQDIAMAESLVEESGYGGIDIELYVPEGRYLNDVEVGQMAADHIDSLDNVNCEANIVDFGVVSDANSAGVDPDEYGDTWEIPFYMIGWGTITGDTDYGVQGFFTIPDNPARTFHDEELSDAILDTQQIEDPDERTEALQGVNAMAREKAPFVFLHVQESIYGVDSRISWEPREDETVYLWDAEI